MTWALFHDLAFYAVLGLFAFCPIVVFVAAVSGQSFEAARKEVTAFLENVGTLAPSDFMGVVLHAAGISTVLFMLSFCAYTANRLGDAVAPTTARWCYFYGNSKVKWSVEHAGDEFRDVKFKLRELTEIRGDRVKWEETKAGMGASDVRLCRTMLVLSGFVLVGGIIGGVCVKGRRWFGWKVAGVAFLALFASQGLWIERESNYVENLVSRYQSERLKAEGELPPLPRFYPGSNQESH